MAPLNRTFLSVTAVALAGGLVLSGCSSDSGDSSASGSSSSTSVSAAPTALPSGMGTDAKENEFPRTVKHFEGSTKISSAPKNVVVLSTGQFDDVLSLGVVPEATTTATKADLVPQYLTEKFPEQKSKIQKVKSAGSRKSPDLEAIADLKPDLILINDTNKDKSVYKSLSGIAPTVVTEGTGVNWKQDFQLVAAALGKTDEAQKKLDEYDQKATDLKKKAKDQGTVSFLRYQSSRTRIWGVSSFVGSIAQDAGLSRPSTQQFGKTSKDISEEQLDQADGDWLFYGAAKGKDSALKKEALWSSLDAVKKDHAVKVDDDMFYLNAGMAAADGVLDTVSEHLK